MKNRLLLFLLGAAWLHVQAQTTQEISTTAGYQRQSFVKLTPGTEKQVLNTAWDIAFTVYGQNDAGIFLNESSGSSMGAPLPYVEVYNGLTDNFADQLDPDFLQEFWLLNSERDWFYGAFNEIRDTNNVNDYGWGLYNPQTQQINGSAVYLIKLRDDSYLKFKAESLINGVYTFRYANLDGSNEQVKTISKADHAGKTLAYFSFTTGNTVDVEPAGGFDLLYCRYTTWLYIPTTMEWTPYDVAGILHARGAQTAEAHNVDPATVEYSNYVDSLRSELDVIGHDWKSFSGTAWSLDAKRVFFLKTAESRVWKLHFIQFGGSLTGKATFEKTDLGIISDVDNPVIPGLKSLIYPNPAQSTVFLALELPAGVKQTGQLLINNLNGATVLSRTVSLREGFQVLEMNVSDWASGSYAAQIILNDQIIPVGKVIKP